MHPPPQTYPVILIQDRYNGVYSGGAWLAIGAADENVDGVARVAWIMDGNGPAASDLDAALFWGEPASWIAVGDTPDEALANLIAKARAINS
jgi:hypothetical protein